MIVLVTRPLEEAETTRHAVLARGHEAMIDPMLTIRFRDDPIPTEGFDALIFTSMNAVAAIAGRQELATLRGFPVMAVGRRTAAAAREAGFGEVAAADGDVAALAAFVTCAFPEPRRFLHLAGADRVADLGALLAPAGHKTALAIVYEARQATAFQPATVTALQAGLIDAVTHFSARTAEAFVACAAGVVSLGTAPLRHACLSDRVAEVLRAVGAPHVLVAATRDESALLDQIAR